MYDTGKLKKVVIQISYRKQLKEISQQKTLYLCGLSKRIKIFIHQQIFPVL